jgi:putative transposase
LFVRERNNPFSNKYQYAVKSWRTNWPYLSTFFKYPKEIRKLIYTTNPIESYNRSVRKISKTKGSFSCDDALAKILYLVTIDVTKKWTQKHRDWISIIGQLAIYFEDRLSGYIR